MLTFSLIARVVWGSSGMHKYLVVLFLLLCRKLNARSRNGAGTLPQDPSFSVPVSRTPDVGPGRGSWTHTAGEGRGGWGVSATSVPLPSSHDLEVEGSQGLLGPEPGRGVGLQGSRRFLGLLVVECPGVSRGF